MFRRDIVRLAGSVGASAAAAILFWCTTGPAVPTRAALPLVAQASIHKPIWADCIANMQAPVLGTAPTFRSSLPFRGLFGAARMQPLAVLASYHGPLRHEGPEMVNLQLALASLDHLVIPPHAEFSFNQAVGPRAEERGYKAGLMYYQGTVVSGVGGGVCVASTALYNAALEAGLPILERWMHSGPTSYASPTRDAAVVYGQKDLRIKNNTAYPICIRAFVEEGHPVVALLSLRPLPYRVVLREEGEGIIASPLKVEQAVCAEPKVLHPGVPGCSERLIREFWTDGRMTKQEVVCSDYRPPHARVVGLPKAAGQSAPMSVPENLLKPVMPPASAPTQIAPPETPQTPEPLETAPATREPAAKT